MSAKLNDPHRAQRELLSDSQLLADLPTALIDELVAASRLVKLEANQNLYVAGDTVREAFILFNGSVQRSVSMPGGTTRVIQLVQQEQLLSPGEVFGARHYESSCTCIAAALLVAIDAHKLRELMHQSRELGCRIASLLAQRLCATEFDATGFHYGLTGAQRLLDYLLELAGDRAGLAGETTVVLKASKKVIAARIGMTPESLSRNLRELSERGVIVVEGRSVHIQNAALSDTVGGNTRQLVNFSRKRKGEFSGRKISSGALINLCGRLRLLSQRMALAWGAVVSGLAPARERARLHQLEKEFVRHLSRLEQLEVDGELRSGMAAIQDLWPDYREALNEEELAGAERVFRLSEDMLAVADGLTIAATRLTGASEVSYVNQAGRNRMLLQRIAKLFLFRDWADLHERVAELSPPSCEEFESNLRELVVAGAQYPEVVAQLDVVDKQWRKFIRALCPDLAYAGRSKHARLVLIESEHLLRGVDTAVKLFERMSK